ncbi:uncharacterized protein LOC105640971 [Jatropha curcas]|uniref:uncharacterized protein LOC105640971 n=1 Tax=Jatropha curcas TaxID=180498 RepID=UPI00189623FF|nr:uncharacterized protein LOC105640971 [Jatropha curcas]
MSWRLTFEPWNPSRASLLPNNVHHHLPLFSVVQNIPLSNSVFGASAPLATPWLAKPKLRNDRHHLLHTKRIIPQLITYSVSRNGSSSSSIEVDVPFPNDYQELLRQCLIPSNRQESKQFAMENNKQLMVKYLTKFKLRQNLLPYFTSNPYFNVNEMLVVEELYKEAVVNTTRKLIIFNGELDRIRSGYYPPFFYPKLASLSKTLFPMMETVYYIHNFKGFNGGTLFRCYPGPWKVLRKVKNAYICLHQQEVMPSLKEVALDILPSV